MNNLDKIFNIKTKTVLITGAGGFFGKYFAEAFLKAGATVILMGRSSLKKTIAEYGKQFGKDKVFGYRVDFYNNQNLEKICKQIVKKHNVNVLINNAYDISPRTGFNTPKGKFENSDYKQWQDALSSGIYWAFLTSKIIGQGMKKRKAGSIINIGSMYGIVSPDPRLYEGTKIFNPPTYGVSKAGLMALTRYTASFWGKYKVRVNTMSPGPFSNTERKTKNSVSAKDPLLGRLRNKTMLNRIGHPNELVGALFFLASDASSYMTGQNLIIDGGWTAI